MKAMIQILVLAFYAMTVQAQNKTASDYIFDAGLYYGDPVAQIRILTEGIKQNQRNTDLYTMRAEIHLTNNSLDLAEADAQSTLKIESKDSKALYILSDIAEKRGKNAEGDLLLEKIYTNNKEEAELIAKRLVIKADKEQSKEKVLRYYQRAVIVFPSAAYYVFLADQQYRNEMIAEAYKNYNKAIELKGDGYYKGMAYMGLANTCIDCTEQKIDSYLLKIIESDLFGAGSLTDYFYPKLSKFKYEDDDFKKLITRWGKLAPNDYYYNLFYGNYQDFLKNYQQAINAYTRSIELKTEIHPNNAIVYFYRGECYHQLSHQQNKPELWVKSEADFSKAILLDEDLLDAYILRVEVKKHMFQSKYADDEITDKKLANEMLKDLKHIISQNSTSAYAYETRALINYILSGEKITDEVLRDEELAEKYKSENQ